MPQELKGKLQKAVSFDEDAIDVTVVGDCEEKKKGPEEFLSVPWRSWRKSPLYVEAGLQRSLEATIVAALRELQLGVDTTSLPIDIKLTRDGRQRKVVATTDIPIGSILIPPCASNKVKILPASSHPHAAKVTVAYNIPSRATPLKAPTTAPADVPGGGAHSGNDAHPITRTEWPDRWHSSSQLHPS